MTPTRSHESPGTTPTHAPVLRAWEVGVPQETPTAAQPHGHATPEATP